MRDYTEDENGHIARVDFDFVIDDQQLEAMNIQYIPEFLQDQQFPPTHALAGRNFRCC